MSDAQQTEATEPTGEATEDKQQEQTFTQADVDRIVRERVKREREKFADYDDLKAKADGAQTVEERVAQLERELATEKAAALKAQVAARFGVSTEPDEETGLSDADLFLTGKDEETLTAQAKRLAKRVSDRESTNNISPTEGGTPRVVPDEKSAFADFLTGHRTA